MYKLNDKVIRMDQDLVIGEGDEAITIPVDNLRNPSFRAQYGIVEAFETTRPDDRHYFVTERPDGSFDAILKPLDFLQKQAWEQIKTKREAVLLGGFRVEDKWFHSDSDSLRKYQYLSQHVKSSKTSEPSILWKTMDGSKVELTPALVKLIDKAAFLFQLEVFEVAEKHKAEMLKTDEPFKYDFSQGWPEIYSPSV